MRLVTPADESIRPLARRVGESAIRRPRDPQGAQQPDLAAAEPEALEDRFLPPGEVRPDAAEARRHLERAHVEVGAALVPAR